jgi:hypothetical protein
VYSYNYSMPMTPATLVGIAPDLGV